MKNAVEAKVDDGNGYNNDVRLIMTHLSLKIIIKFPLWQTINLIRLRSEFNDKAIKVKDQRNSRKYQNALTQSKIFSY